MKSIGGALAANDFYAFLALNDLRWRQKWDSCQYLIQSHCSSTLERGAGNKVTGVSQSHPKLSAGMSLVDWRCMFECVWSVVAGMTMSTATARESLTSSSSSTAKTTRNNHPRPTAVARHLSIILSAWLW